MLIQGQLYSVSIVIGKSDSYHLSLADSLKGFRRKFRKELVGVLKSELNCPDKKILIISGSLPTGVDASVYKKLCTIGRNSGALVVLDCDGEALKTGLKATPDLIKPNRRELEELTGADLSGNGEDVRIDAVKACLEFFRSIH